MGENIDKINFLDLQSCDPEEVTQRTGCEFDRTTNRYFLSVWGHGYGVDLTHHTIEPKAPGSETYHEYLYLFILHYLMKSKNIPLSGEWVSEKDIPGGAAFFRGPHTIPTALVTAAVKDDLTLFAKKCEKLAGSPIDLADAAYRFDITPTIPVAVLYWQGDDDFPSEARLLFDKTIQEHLPLDIIYALAVEVCHSLEK